MFQSKGRGCQAGIKEPPNICCPKVIHFRSKWTTTLKVKGWKNAANSNHIRARTGKFTSGERDFKKCTKGKEGYFMIINRSIPRKRCQL